MKDSQNTAQSSKVSYTEEIKQQLSKLNACFFLGKGEVKVLSTPNCFYNTLKQKISVAKNRIFLASLYIGTTETELIQCISDALDRNADLKVYFLVDGLRGTREAPKSCSASLLSELVKSHRNRVDIRLYRTPDLTPFKEAVVPRRFNEGIGLQHMKIYGIDDEVILSGANLSNDYFSNRQDRYYLFKSQKLAGYYFRLHQLVSSMSYQVHYSETKQKYKMIWPHDNIAVDPRADKASFLSVCSRALKQFLMDPIEGENNSDDFETNGCCTRVYPVSQFTPLFRTSAQDYSTEKPTILQILSHIPDSSVKWTFTAGYFNMLPEIKSLLLGAPSKKGSVITASPFANGFYQSKGVSKYLPSAYLHLSEKFLLDVRSRGKDSQISLNEWKKGIVNTPDGWSYHAKGIWLSDNNVSDQRPAITIIGSSNYTRRAYSVDLESNVVLVTEDSDLKHEMQAEIDRIMCDTKPVTIEDFKSDPQRHVSLGIQAATKIIGKRL
ncbi:LAQU0S02e04060g1_1 [Lachancea quebecensis]|uniref:CDP-diacylglycerol--glycerol-3-phosphate 3-phosphatidyltransferase n=1 Tax=Lachancea quebecensis TaxID=1654605 RepID=A0A0P1KQI5_9SACH|nr:LAQU0S02e04060g1_1 [Lachancea quebecensis]